MSKKKIKEKVKRAAKKKSTCRHAITFYNWGDGYSFVNTNLEPQKKNVLVFRCKSHYHVKIDGVPLTMDIAKSKGYRPK